MADLDTNFYFLNKNPSSFSTVNKLLSWFFFLNWRIKNLLKVIVELFEFVYLGIKVHGNVFRRYGFCGHLKIWINLSPLKICISDQSIVL